MVGVEAEKAPAMLKSIEADKIIELDSADTFADGIAVRKSGEINFKIVKKYVDSLVTVSEEEIKNAIFTLAKEAKIIAEGAGAASVAALLSKKIDTENISNIVCMISGGNIDIDMLSDILDDFNI